MHKEARQYVEKVKGTFPSFFQKCRVLEIGSRNINGAIRGLFDECEYLGLDLEPGNGVDMVCHGADFHTAKPFNTIISMEALEHDKRWKETLQNAVKLLAHNGLLIVTAAGPNRGEHGTHGHAPGCSPCTLDYYGNLSKLAIKDAILRDESVWLCYDLRYSENNEDVYFHGVKK